MHNDHNVYVYELGDDGKGAMKATLVPGFPQKGGQEKIFMANWSLASDEFATVGPKHIKFWTLQGKSKAGIFGSSGNMTSFSCVTFDDKGAAYTGGANGMIYKWNGSNLGKTA
mmetsp:Transcript_14203/g.10270  ORF Transcript_14203/g.10270 Transcript_14203/m.10270 type:complete len:113 (+) Transcript_14203:885-1223(+)